MGTVTHYPTIVDPATLDMLGKLEDRMTELEAENAKLHKRCTACNHDADRQRSRAMGLEADRDQMREMKDNALRQRDEYAKRLQAKGGP